MMHSMFPIIPLATDPGDLRPVESLALTTPLVVAIVGALPRHEAFVELSVIARDFAGAASGKELSSSTLTDLAYLNRTPANRQGLDALKQTIGALYPPEFADDARNRIAQTTSVQQAAEWVANLVERWRS